MSGRSPPYGRGECELGDPGVRPFVPCKHLVPACPLRGCSPAALCPRTSGIPRRGWNWARRPEGGACGFHSYPRGSRHHAGQGAWAGEAAFLPSASGALGRGAASGPGLPLVPAARPERPLLAGGVAALSEAPVLAAPAGERVPPRVLSVPRPLASVRASAERCLPDAGIARCSRNVY